MKKASLFFFAVAAIISIAAIGCSSRRDSNARITEDTGPKTPEMVEIPENSSTSNELDITEWIDISESFDVSEGFSTPEGAVYAYLEALKDADFDRMLSIFAIENYNYDFETDIYQSGIFKVWFSPLPNINELTKAMNTEFRRLHVSASIFLQNRDLRIPYSDDRDALPPSYLSFMDPSIRSTIKLSKTGNDISEMIERIKKHLDSASASISTLKVLGFIPKEAAYGLLPYSDAFWQESFSDKEKVIGAESITFCIALFELGGDMFLFSPDVVNYHGRWYIEQFSGYASRAFCVEFKEGMETYDGGIHQVPIENYDYFNTKLVPVKSIQALSGEETNTPEKVEGDGFDTSEDAVAAYLTALKNSDFDQMMSTFVVETYVRKANYEKYLNSVGHFNTWEPIFLNDNEYEFAANLESRRGGIADAIITKYKFLCLNNIEKIPDPDYWVHDGDILRLIIDVGKNEEDVTKLVNWITECLDSAHLRSINLLGFIPRESLVDNFLDKSDWDYIETLDNIEARCYGADMMTSCAAIFEIDGKSFLFCPDTICYGDKWYLYSLAGYTSKYLCDSFDASSVGGDVGIIPLNDELYSKLIIHVRSL